MDFDPNFKDKPGEPQWATYIPDRRGAKFKVHKGLGQAKNAFHYRDNAILYEWVDGEWVERYRIENHPGRPTCVTEGCNHTASGYQWKGMEFVPKKCYNCQYPRHGHTCRECGSVVR